MYVASDEQLRSIQPLDIWVEWKLSVEYLRGTPSQVMVCMMFTRSHGSSPLPSTISIIGTSTSSVILLIYCIGAFIRSRQSPAHSAASVYCTGILNETSLFTDSIMELRVIYFEVSIIFLLIRNNPLCSMDLSVLWQPFSWHP